MFFDTQQKYTLLNNIFPSKMCSAENKNAMAIDSGMFNVAGNSMFQCKLKLAIDSQLSIVNARINVY